MLPSSFSIYVTPSPPLSPPSPPPVPLQPPPAAAARRPLPRHTRNPLKPAWPRAVWRGFYILFFFDFSSILAFCQPFLGPIFYQREIYFNSQASVCLAVDWQRLDWPQAVWLNRCCCGFGGNICTLPHTLSAAQFTLFSRKEASTCSRQQQIRRAASQQFAQQKNSRKPPAPENLRTCMAGCQPFPRSTQE